MLILSHGFVNGSILCQLRLPLSGSKYILLYYIYIILYILYIYFQYVCVCVCMLFKRGNDFMSTLCQNMEMDPKLSRALECT